MPKSRIRSYALIGFKDTPSQAWERCEAIESNEAKALPMWFHELDAKRWNDITEKQTQLGWTKQERTNIMRWHYKHAGERGPIGP